MAETMPGEASGHHQERALYGCIGAGRLLVRGVAGSTKVLQCPW